MKCMEKGPAYVQGYIDGTLKVKRANGLDWAEARVEVLNAMDRARQMMAEKDAQIAALRRELEETVKGAERMLREQEEKYIDLESRYEAVCLAWKHRKEEV